MNKEGWEFKSDTHEFFLYGKRIPSVSQILTACGIIDYSHIEPHVRESAMHFGKSVHIATQLYDKGVLDCEELDDEIVPYINGWDKFKKETGVKFKFIEKVMVSLRNRFGGILDRLTEDLILIDIKTGKDSKYGADLQTAGYGILLLENYRIKILKRLIVFLKPDDYSLIPCTNRADTGDFLLCRQMCNLYEKRRQLWQKIK